MKILRTAAVILLILVGGIFVLVRRPEIAAITPPPAGSFDSALVKQGAQLAAIGNCDVCHTAGRGHVFAGGRALPTQFGTIFSTNITPDADTGIGKWSEDAFKRSMRKGIDREGRHLYPAFPYDHFSRVSDEDLHALYAFLMTREPIRASAPGNELAFPFNIRALLAGWNLLFLRDGAYQPESKQSAEWNRGAYLVDGLAHCGGCHTPRNALGAEKRRYDLAGGETEGWFAYPINEASTSPIPWNTESLAAYLQNGWHAEHGISRGPMSPVTANLGRASREDVHAIATYIVSRMGPPSDARVQRAQALASRAAQPAAQASIIANSAQSQGAASGASAPDVPLGASIYQGACASCHDGARPLPFGGIDFHLSTAVSGPDPRNIINVVRHGLPAEDGRANPVMPGFAGAMDDEQLAALLNYLRAEFSADKPWPNVEQQIESARRDERDEHGTLRELGARRDDGERRDLAEHATEGS